MAASAASAPIACIEINPTTQTVRLRGVPIQLTALAAVSGLHISYLSRVLSGKRRCTLEAAEVMSKSLGMELHEFIQALRETQRSRQKKSIR